ncbi:MAG: tyrosine-type recombinase/integrase, partial [Candidatus Accumulibacter sp.]|nr:tyrosine-type recombinase/integrase [Accumulibacter sp.]
MNTVIEANSADLAEIDAFCDALWLEDGLAKASLSSYRSDLTHLARWLAEQRIVSLCAVDDLALIRFVAMLSQTRRASSQARAISTLRRFYRHLLARGRIKHDPTLKISMPVKASRLPKVLSERDVEALLTAPSIETPLGLRDRAMLETLYATGLRVSELVGLKLYEVSFDMNVVRVFGKGSKERLVPLGEQAVDWLRRYLDEARSGLLGQHRSD